RARAGSARLRSRAWCCCAVNAQLLARLARGLAQSGSGGGAAPAVGRATGAPARQEDRGSDPARKLLTIAFHVLGDGTTYDPAASAPGRRVVHRVNRSIHTRGRTPSDRERGSGILRQRASRHDRVLAFEAQEENRPPLWSSLVCQRARMGEWTVYPRPTLA